jgi:hypothetical protein
MENITLDRLSEELSQLNSEIDLTQQSIEATQIELDQTEEQIKVIEERKIEKMRSQIEIAKKTLADKRLVLQDRQELLKARQSYLQKLKGNVDEVMTPTLEHDSSDAKSSVMEDLELDSSTAIALEEKPEATSDRHESNFRLLKELQSGLDNKTLSLTQEGYLTNNGFTTVCLEIKHQSSNEQEDFISKFVNYFRPLLTDEQVNTIEQLPRS